MVNNIYAVCLPGRALGGQADEVCQLTGTLVPRQQVHQLASKRIVLWWPKLLSENISAVTENGLYTGSCGRLGSGPPMCIKNEDMSVSDHNKSHSMGEQ